MSETQPFNPQQKNQETLSNIIGVDGANTVFEKQDPVSRETMLIGMMQQLDKQLADATTRELRWYIDTQIRNETRIIPNIPVHPTIRLEISGQQSQKLVTDLKNGDISPTHEMAGSLFLNPPTENKKVYTLNDIHWRKKGSSDAVMDGHKPNLPGEILIHTHTVPGYYGKTDFGDFAKILQNPGWIDPGTRDQDPKRRFFSILSVDLRGKRMRLDTYFHDTTNVDINSKTDVPKHPFGLWKLEPIRIGEG